jgi:hypothetical protein
MPKVESKKLIVVIDDREAYHGKDGINYVENMSHELSKKYGKEIICITGKRKSDRYLDHIQTNDVVAHAIHDRKETHNPFASLVMRQKIQRVGKNDSIKRR